MKEQVIYSITLKEGKKTFAVKETKKYETALTIFRRTVKQVASIGADIFTHTTVILSRNGKKSKSVRIDSKFH